MTSKNTQINTVAFNLMPRCVRHKQCFGLSYLYVYFNFFQKHCKGVKADSKIPDLTLKTNPFHCYLIVPHCKKCNNPLIMKLNVYFTALHKPDNQTK